MKTAVVTDTNSGMTIQGEKLDAFAKARGFRSAMKKMLEATATDLEKKFSGISREKVLVGAAGTLAHQEEIENWSRRVKDTFPGYSFLYHPLSCRIACHTGPGAVGTGFVVMERMS